MKYLVEHGAFIDVESCPPLLGALINGYPEGTFKPENPVTYAESMAMILRALKLEDSMSDKSWPLGYINEGRSKGLLENVDYNEPNVPANRGETAISLYNMISIIESKYSKMLNATYSNKNGQITLKEDEEGGVTFDFMGKSMGTDWSLGTTLDYAVGVASIEEEFFDDIVKIKIIFGDDIITVEASSTDPESGYNGINGTYQLKSFN